MEERLIEQIFWTLGDDFRTERVGESTTYYFSIDEVKRTVTLTPDAYKVEEGKTIESADCVCKMHPQLFLKVWNEGYQPGMKDFLSGAIKSNDPQKLKTFLRAFGR